MKCKQWHLVCLWDLTEKPCPLFVIPRITSFLFTIKNVHTSFLFCVEHVLYISQYELYLSILPLANWREPASLAMFDTSKNANVKTLATANGTEHYLQMNGIMIVAGIGLLLLKTKLMGKIIYVYTLIMYI